MHRSGHGEPHHLPQSHRRFLAASGRLRTFHVDARQPECQRQRHLHVGLWRRKPCVPKCTAQPPLRDARRCEQRVHGVPARHQHVRLCRQHEPRRGSARHTHRGHGGAQPRRLLPTGSDVWQPKRGWRHLHLDLRHRTEQPRDCGRTHCGVLQPHRQRGDVHRRVDGQHRCWLQQPRRDLHRSAS